MEQLFARLPREEQAVLTLRSLFEEYGYRRYEMSSFETYDLYHDNKSFLRGGIITFTDAYGRLMALKPDVTMSIVKNTKPEQSEAKLYYIENVFRTAQHGGEMREISQMGVESIGAEGAYAEAEVVLLAAQSLAAIHGEWALSLSHMGFVHGLFSALRLPEQVCAEAMEALRGKNAHALRALAQQAGCGEAEAEALAALAALNGPFESVLESAAALARNEEMREAVAALTVLYEVLCALHETRGLRLDFSVAGDMDYYNGLLLLGYVKGVPHAVLTGGRYDSLMRRFGKPQAALGFALGLGELGRAFAGGAAFDVDAVLLYSATQPAALVAQAVEALVAQGKRVRAARAVPENLRAREILRLLDSGETEVAVC